MNQIFGYYCDETNEAQIYDGSKGRKLITGNEDKFRVEVPMIFDGKCTKELFDKIIKEQRAYEKNNSKAQ